LPVHRVPPEYLSEIHEMRQGREMGCDANLASAASRAADGNPPRKARIRGRSRTCRMPPTCPGAAGSRGVERFAEQPIPGPVGDSNFRTPLGFGWLTV